MDQLVALFSRDLWTFFVHHRYNLADAEDLYQETWAKILSHLRHLKDPTRFRSWAFSIAINNLRGLFRKQRPSDSEWLEDLVSLEPSPEQVTENRQAHHAMILAMGDLSERDRTILILDCVSGVPQQEIADLMDENLNTVKTIVRRAKLKLAKALMESGHVS